MKKLIVWAIRLTAAIILLQTLFFKFTGSAESVSLFTKLGVEPYGRIGSGIMELITAILILYPRTTIWGALTGFFLMSGAIMSHFLILGIEVDNDGGTLFIIAVITFLCCLALILLEKEKLFRIIKFKFK